MINFPFSTSKNTKEFGCSLKEVQLKELFQVTEHILKTVKDVFKVYMIMETRFLKVSSCQKMFILNLFLMNLAHSTKNLNVNIILKSQQTKSADDPQQVKRII